MSTRIAIVTGSNSGIGLAIVRSLCKQLSKNGVIYLTSRNEGRCKEAIELLEKEGLSPRFHILDVNNETGIGILRDHIKSEHGGFDILVNNAGILYMNADAIQTEKTIGTNYFGLLNVIKALLPLIRPGGRVVNVASGLGRHAFEKSGEEVHKRFKEAITETDITGLMNEFLGAVKAGNHKEKGWPDWEYHAYATSKLGVIALTRIFGRESAKDANKNDVLINCCCPGLIATNMTTHIHGPKGTPDQGADTPVYLALLPPGTQGIQGAFVSKRKVDAFLTS